MNEVEEGQEVQLDFSKLDRLSEQKMSVIPVAVQHADTREVLQIGYVNEFALREGARTRALTLWSSSRNKLHIKGEKSGETYDLIEVFVNCEQNSLLFTVRPKRGKICHTVNRQGQPRNCFYRRLDMNAWRLENLDP